MFTIGDRHFRWEFPEGSPHHLKNSAILGSAEETESDVEDGKILSPINKAPTLPMEIPISKRLAELEAEGNPSKRKLIKIVSGSGSVVGGQQRIDTVFADIESYDAKDQITAIEYMEDQIKRFKLQNME